MPPIENDDLRQKAARIESKLRFKFQSHCSSEEEAEIYEGKIKKKLFAQLRKTVYHWKPIEYDFFQGILYMYSRFPAEYAVLNRIFSEITARDKSFSPEFTLDFGSGIGSVLWAVNNTWQDQCKVALCVDTSTEMSKLAKLLAQGGKVTGKSFISGLFFKQLVPHGEVNNYDLVTCAYSLLEMESKEKRFNLLETLFSKTRKYLVIVDQGTTGGWQVISEARNFFINFPKSKILAPCPHMSTCPRVSSKELDPICSFGVRYHPLRLVTVLIFIFIVF